MLSTREKILVQAELFIRTKGYNAFSYADIAAELKMKNAAIHYYFPTKSELGLAMIKKVRTDFNTKIEVWNTLSYLSQINAFIDIYAQSKSQNYVCFMGALGQAYDTFPKNMQEELTLASQEIKDWLLSVLEKGKNNEVFNFKDEIEALADLIISALLASLIIDRVGKGQAFENVKHLILTKLLIKQN